MVNFIVTNNNNPLFLRSACGIGDGDLTYTPALNANGTVIVSVKIHDNGGTTPVWIRRPFRPLTST